MLNPSRTDAGIIKRPPQWPPALQSPRSGCYCVQCFDEATGRLQAMDSAPVRHKAQDSDPGASERGFEQAEIALAHNRKRGENAIDTEEADHPVGCRCDEPKCVDAFKKKQAADARVKAAADAAKAAAAFKKIGDEAVNMVGQLVQRAKKKAATDALNAQRAWDRAVEADQLADVIADQQRNAAYDESVRAWGKWMQDPLHVQRPDKTARATDGRSLGPQHADAYSDLGVGGYRPARAKLRGEDAELMSGEEKFAAVAAADDQFYAASRALLERPYSA